MPLMDEMLPLPEGMPVGHVIGPSGRNMKRLKEATRVFTQVDGEQRTISLKGGARGLGQARDMVSELFNDFQTYKTFDVRCDLLEASAFPDGADVQFVQRTDEVSQYVGTTATTYVLVPAAAGRGAGSASPEDRMALALAVASLSPTGNVSDGVQTIYSATAAASRMTLLAAAAADAACHKSDFAEITLRFNFGKMFLCKLKVPAGVPISQETLQNMRYHQDFDNFFSNCVPPQTAQRLPGILLGLGFQLVDMKHSLTVHVEDLLSLLARGFALSFDRGDGLAPSDQLLLRKMKTGSQKVSSLTSVGHGTQDIDFRFKLLAKHFLDEGSALGARLKDLAQHCHATAHGAGWVLARDAMDVHLQRLRLGLKTSRFKCKRVFQGSLRAGGASSITLRVSIVTVQSASYSGLNTTGTATEVAGSCVELSAALEELRCSGEAQRLALEAKVACLTGQLQGAVRVLAAALTAAGSATLA